MTDRDIIRAEIERLKECCDYNEENAYDKILSFIDSMPEQKGLAWTEDAERKIRARLEYDYKLANNMVNFASRSGNPFKKGTELIMVKESAESIIKLIKKEIGV